MHGRVGWGWQTRGVVGNGAEKSCCVLRAAERLAAGKRTFVYTETTGTIRKTGKQMMVER